MTTIIEQLYAEMQASRDAANAAEFRADQAEYEIFTRAKYSTQDKKDALAAGHAMANPNGDPSYPIKDKEDLTRAISAVGRGSADHDSIRQHIIKRAKALGLTSLIPENWDMTTGALTDATQTNSEHRVDNADANADTKDCPTCQGSGSIMNGNRECPTCKGEGVVPKSFEGEKKSAQVPVMTWIGETNADVSRNVNHVPDYRAAPADAEDRVNAHREQQVIAEILALPEEQREEMIVNAPEPEEIRTALATYRDTENAVESALTSALGGKDEEFFDVWVEDVSEEEDGEDRWAVFSSFVDPPGTGCFRVPFTRDDAGITFTGNPEPVARVTTYESIQTLTDDEVAAAATATAERDAEMAAAIARDTDMLALERERDADAEIRAQVIENRDHGQTQPCPKATKRSYKNTK